MLAPILALYLQTQPPKTFEDLELAKISAYHELHNFREEMSFNIGGAQFHRTTLLDGDRNHVTISLPDDSKVEAVSDGTTSWAIFHGQKAYIETKLDKTTPFDPHQYLLKCDPDSFNFNFNSAQPLQFAANPPLSIDSIETVKDGDETLRKVVASKTKPNGHFIRLTQWFLADKWIVRKVLIEGIGEGGPVKGGAEATKLDFHAQVSSADFALDPSLVSGYQKQEGG